MTDETFSDEQLVAYLDSEFEHAPMDEISSALKTDAALAKRLAQLRIDTGALQAAFEPLATGQWEASNQTVRTRNWSTWKSAVVAGLIMLPFGAILGGIYTNQQSQNWTNFVAIYQALYTNGTLAHIDPLPSAQRVEIARVSQAIDKVISLQSLTGIAGVEYKRAQILGYQGKALIQLAFLSSTGEPIALCIFRPDDVRQDKVIEQAVTHGMSAATWSAQGYSYLLIGGQDDDLIGRLAREFKTRGV